MRNIQIPYLYVRTRNEKMICFGVPNRLPGKGGNSFRRQGVRRGEKDIVDKAQKHQEQEQQTAQFPVRRRYCADEMSVHG